MTKLLSTVLVLSLVSVAAQGASLLTWDFAGLGGSSSVVAQTADPGVSMTAPSGVASIGPGLTTTSYLSNGLTARNSRAMTLEDALAADDYISFSVAAAGSSLLTLESVELRPVSQNRERSFALLSSVDGWSAGSVVGNFGPAERVVLPTSFTNLADPVEFRLYVYGYNNAWESVGLGNSDAGTGGPEDLIIQGSIVAGSPIPEPLTMFGALGAVVASAGYLRRRLA